MKNKSFGLDIGTNSMKAVWFETQSNGYSLLAANISNTPEKGMLSESPLDQEEMAQTIHTMVSEAAIGTKYVNIALPESQVYTRVIEMPILSDSELQSAIYWEAEQYIPVPLSTVTLDYKLLRKPQAPEDGNKMDILLVGAPTALIDKYEKILMLAGLTITSVETEILSVIRSVVTQDNFPTSIIVNMGATSTSLAIVRKGFVSFVYSIPTGGIAITRAIASAFGFSLQQAEEYKKIYGLSPENLGGKIGQAAQPVLSLIIAEMKKSIAYYNEKFANEPLQQVILCGGGAKLPGITTFFTNAIGLETTISNPWKILVAQEVPKDIIDNASLYNVAVGLAIR